MQYIWYCLIKYLRCLQRSYPPIYKKPSFALAIICEHLRDNCSNSYTMQLFLISATRPAMHNFFIDQQTFSWSHQTSTKGLQGFAYSYVLESFSHPPSSWVAYPMSVGVLHRQMTKHIERKNQLQGTASDIQDCKIRGFRSWAALHNFIEQALSKNVSVHRACPTKFLYM